MLGIKGDHRATSADRLLLVLPILVLCLQGAAGGEELGDVVRPYRGDYACGYLSQKTGKHKDELQFGNDSNATGSDWKRAWVVFEYNGYYHRQTKYRVTNISLNVYYKKHRGGRAELQVHDVTEAVPRGTAGLMHNRFAAGTEYDLWPVVGAADTQVLAPGQSWTPQGWQRIRLNNDWFAALDGSFVLGFRLSDEGQTDEEKLRILGGSGEFQPYISISYIHAEANPHPEGDNRLGEHRLENVRLDVPDVKTYHFPATLAVGTFDDDEGRKRFALEWTCSVELGDGDRLERIAVRSGPFFTWDRVLHLRQGECDGEVAGRDPEGSAVSVDLRFEGTVEFGQSGTPTHGRVTLFELDSGRWEASGRLSWPLPGGPLAGLPRAAKPVRAPSRRPRPRGPMARLWCSSQQGEEHLGLARLGPFEPQAVAREAKATR